MIKNYIKISFKLLMRRKFYTFITLFGISFTLMFVMVVLSFIENTFGPKYPELKLDRTLSVTMANLRTDKGSVRNGPIFSYHFLDKYVKSLKTAEKVSISSIHNTLITYRNGKRVNFAIKYCDSEFFDILDFKFVEGKPFNLDDVENQNRVIVINRSTRDRYFGKSGVIGEKFEIKGENYIVIGVVNDVSIMRIVPYSDVWIPVTLSDSDISKKSLEGNAPSFVAMVLAKSSDDIPLVKSEYRDVVKRIDIKQYGYSEMKTDLDTYAEALSRQFLRSDRGNSDLFVYIFVAVVSLFMLLPVVNIININISRIMERSSEIGIRKAFGASKRSLVTQFLIENIIITTIGGMIGLLLTYIVITIFNSSNLIEYSRLSLDLTTFFYSFLVTIFFALFSGVYPAYRMAKLTPVEALR